MSPKEPMEVDLVYLWVNGNDPQWRAKRNAVIGRTEDGSAVNCEGRYADNDELKFSLRAVEMYAPWIRKIFIVTDNQVPAWLDTSNPKIRIVDHTEILPPEARPSFNSSVIEHFICRIPDLGEHYLYANDDMFVNRPVTPLDFFTPDGLPVIRFNRRPFRKLTLFLKEKVLGKKISSYNRKIQNAARAVERKLGVYIGDKSHHNIDSYNKSYCRRVYDMFREEIEPTLPHHVRDDRDIQRNLYSYAAIVEKQCRLEYVSQKTSFRFHIDNHEHYKKLEKYNPMLFCMNDSEYAVPADRELVTEYLNTRFPHKSAFEK